MLVRPASSEVYFQALGADASTLPLPVRMADTFSGGTAHPWGIAGASDGRFALLFGQRVQVVNADGSVTTPSISTPSLYATQIAFDGTTWVVAGTRSATEVSPRDTQVLLLRGATLSATHVGLQRAEHRAGPPSRARDRRWRGHRGVDR
jgi:hypothetical protein